MSSEVSEVPDETLRQKAVGMIKQHFEVTETGVDKDLSERARKEEDEIYQRWRSGKGAYKQLLFDRIMAIKEAYYIDCASKLQHFEKTIEKMDQICQGLPREHITQYFSACRAHVDAYREAILSHRDKDPKKIALNRLKDLRQLRVAFQSDMIEFRNAQSLLSASLQQQHQQQQQQLSMHHSTPAPAKPAPPKPGPLPSQSSSFPLAAPHSVPTPTAAPPHAVTHSHSMHTSHSVPSGHANGTAHAAMALAAPAESRKRAAEGPAGPRAKQQRTAQPDGKGRGVGQVVAAAAHSAAAAHAMSLPPAVHISAAPNSITTTVSYNNNNTGNISGSSSSASSSNSAANNSNVANGSSAGVGGAGRGAASAAMGMPPVMLLMKNVPTKVKELTPAELTELRAVLLPRLDVPIGYEPGEDGNGSGVLFDERTRAVHFS